MKPTEVVIKSIRESYPKDADSIISELKYNSLCGYWYFTRWGMFFGIEKDGEIHT
jgi:hypothetical protein